MIQHFPKDILWLIFDELDLYDFEHLAKCCKDYRNLGFTIYLTRKWETYDRRLWYKKLLWIKQYNSQEWSVNSSRKKTPYSTKSISVSNVGEPVLILTKYPLSRVYQNFKFSINYATCGFSATFGFVNSVLTKKSKKRQYYKDDVPSCTINFLIKSGYRKMWRSKCTINTTTQVFDTHANCINVVSPQVYDQGEIVCELVTDFKKKIICFHVNGVNVASFGWSEDKFPDVYPVVGFYNFSDSSIELKLGES